MKHSLILSFFLLPLSSLAAVQIFYYRPTVVELTGKLELQTFPGPPNYESISSGDQIERGFYLKLDAPINVSAGKLAQVDISDPEKNVRILQLAINGEDDPLWAKFKAAGKVTHVRIKGGLFHRFTGHHHARILLNVEAMNILSSATQNP